jgi:hypothetical protein
LGRKLQIEGTTDTVWVYALALSQLDDPYATIGPEEAARADVDLEPLPEEKPAETDKPKRGGGRKPLPESLRREIIEVPLPPEERICVSAAPTPPRLRRREAA